MVAEATRSLIAILIMEVAPEVQNGRTNAMLRNARNTTSLFVKRFSILLYWHERVPIIK